MGANNLGIIVQVPLSPRLARLFGLIVVPLQDLDEYMPNWDEREEEIPLDQLEEDDVTTFVYPRMRLDLIEPSYLRD